MYLLIPFSTIASLSITDLTSLGWAVIGLSIASNLLIISQCIVSVVLS